MKVSIIIPVYNVEEYIKECLESAVNQTLKDIEIICINDGSTDSSLDILNGYSKKYNNITVINQENKGVSAARNMGIKVARGEFIYFLDSDDYIDIDAMRICYDRSNEFDIDILTFDASCFYDKRYKGNKNIEDYDRSFLLPQIIMTGKEFYITSSKMKCYKSPVWLNFYKRNFIEEKDLMFKEGIIHEDEIYTLKSLIEAEKVMYISNKLFNRRIRNNSIMTSSLNNKHIEGNFEIVKTLYDTYQVSKKNGDTELSKVLKKNINMYIISTLHRCDSLKESIMRNEVVKFIKQIKEVIDINVEIQANKPSLYYSNTEDFNRKLEIQNYKYIKKIFYMLIPTHGNLGDQAIADASIRYMEDNYPEHKIIKINYEETTKYIHEIKEVTNKDDMVFLHGGGNMGNHYICEEQARRFIIQTLDNVPIISFTQTIYFSNDNEGKKELEISKKVYNNHRQLTLLAREEVSYKIMKEQFYNCKVYLCPDIVFYLNDKIEGVKGDTIGRKCIMTCLRQDKETYYSLEDKKLLINEIRNKFELIEKDTIVNYRVDNINRNEELNNIWCDFYKSKVVITDRLHGMIFAAITKTPCIVLRSLDYKVTESYKWIKDLNYIKMTDDLSSENIEKLVNELLDLSELDSFDFDNRYFKI